MRTLRRWFGAALAVVALGACGGPGATSEIRSGAPTTTIASRAAAEPASTAKVRVVGACALVSLADAERVTHVQLRADPNASGRSGPDCTYLPAEAGGLTVVKVHLSSGGATAVAPSTLPGERVVDVEGVGDDAVAVDGGAVGSLIVNVDDQSVTVTVSDGESNDLEAEKALADIAVEALS